MMYGRTPVSPFDTQDANVTLNHDPEYSNKLKNYLSSLTGIARKNILTTQDKYKQRYDSHRTDPSYKIGDLVLVKTLNLRHKFDLRYEGPFGIIQEITPKTYIIQHIKKSTLTRQVTTDVLLPIFERIN